MSQQAHRNERATGPLEARIKSLPCFICFIFFTVHGGSEFISTRRLFTFFTTKLQFEKKVYGSFDIPNSGYSLLANGKRLGNHAPLGGYPRLLVSPPLKTPASSALQLSSGDIVHMKSRLRGGARDHSGSDRLGCETSGCECREYKRSKLDKLCARCDHEASCHMLAMEEPNAPTQGMPRHTTNRRCTFRFDFFRRATFLKTHHNETRFFRPRPRPTCVPCGKKSGRWCVEVQ